MRKVSLRVTHEITVMVDSEADFDDVMSNLTLELDTDEGDVVYCEPLEMTVTDSR
jgi:hypothetical protein